MGDKFICGGPDARRIHAGRQFMAALQEVNEEPAIVIWPKNRSVLSGRGAGAMIVCLSSYGRYFDEDFRRAKPSEYAVTSIAAALEVLGFDSFDRSAAHEIMDILINYADDVVRMPPDMDQRRRREEMNRLPRYAEAVEITANGETIGRIEAKH